jgi:hypothetical protein
MELLGARVPISGGRGGGGKVCSNTKRSPKRQLAFRGDDGKLKEVAMSYEHNLEG